MQELQWRTLGGIKIEDLAQKVEQTIQAELALGNKLKICIGCDSQMFGKKCEFATVVVFLREKKGGFLFLAKEHIDKYYGSLKQRMLDEVSRSIGVAYELCPILDKFGIPMEVHADINQNPNFESNVALKEAMGYILGMGFIFKGKPDAFASSRCADKVVH